MSKKTLKFDNIRFNKNKFDKSKQPINLNLAQIVVSDKLKHSDGVLSILLVTKKARLLNRYVLSYPKSVYT